MSGTLVDDGQAVQVLLVPCDVVPVGLPVGATSAADLGWRRERSYKMTEQVARRSSRGITGEHHQRKAPLMKMYPGLGCRAQVVLWCSVVLFLLLLFAVAPKNPLALYLED